MAHFSRGNRRGKASGIAGFGLPQRTPKTTHTFAFKADKRVKDAELKAAGKRRRGKAPRVNVYVDKHVLT